MNYALTVYPLSAGFRGRLARALADEPTYLNLAELRKLPVPRAIARLRGLEGARLVLPLEDENSRSVLPVLTAVAALSNARSVEIRYPDLRAETISRWDLVRGLGSLARASAQAAAAAARCHRELTPLLAAPRTTPAWRADGRILYVNANLWFGVKAGGSIGHIAGVVNALSRKGHEVQYATAGGRTMIDAAVPSIALDAPSAFGLPHEINYYLFHRMAARQLLGQPAPRFIYQRLSVANYTGVVLSRAWNVPLVLEYNGSEAWIAKHWGRPLRFHGLAARAEAAALRHAHVVVTISEALRDELVEKGVEPERIVCYPNCIDPMVFDPARFSHEDVTARRQRLGIRRDAVVAAFIGTFGQWHGAEVLAQAIRRLADTDREWLRHSRLHFLLVGDGLRMPAVRATLEGCDEFVTFTGLVPQAEAPEYLAAADVLVSPHVGNADGSRFFGSPTKLFEYMAMGKAIVASDLDQIGHVLRNSVRTGDFALAAPAGDSRLAVLFPPGDVAALVESLRFVVDRPLWRAALGANARREALERYTWSHHVAAILGCIDDVCR